MPLDSMMLYSCANCGETKSGMEWDEDTGRGEPGKEYYCTICKNGLNEDELYSEED